MDARGAKQFDRRNFLSAAAFGAASVGGAATSAFAASSHSSSSFGDVVAFEGILRDSSHGRIALEVENEVRELPIAPAATHWRVESNRYRPSAREIRS